ncbi:hypothetical protein [Dyella acidiphila]|uniref:DUF4175 domain-containing protein n=1 Tax=Dyella acidiphila TaxID=2775866 RepID=A0ABR9GCC2_9GAMM|nr:hypothetical protein [Dyella acidiphila]MBE1161711.1 hypothetical protein [Dyella acidiphila]
MSRPETTRRGGRIWGVPTILAVLTVWGLLSALLGDRLLWKVIAWIALLIPVVVAAWCSLRRRRA